MPQDASDRFVFNAIKITHRFFFFFFNRVTFILTLFLFLTSWDHVTFRKFTKQSWIVFNRANKVSTFKITENNAIIFSNFEPLLLIYSIVKTDLISCFFKPK